MGSDSDLPVMAEAAKVLEQARRRRTSSTSPRPTARRERTVEIVAERRGRGVRVFIVGAGARRPPRRRGCGAHDAAGLGVPWPPPTCRVWTRCSPRCRCRPASRWARWPSARPERPTRPGSPRRSSRWRTRASPGCSRSGAGRWRTAWPKERGGPGEASLAPRGLTPGWTDHATERGFHTITLGCKLNQFDSAAIEGELVRRGFHAEADLARAAVVVLNTCTVTHKADAEARKLIRRSGAATRMPPAGHRLLRRTGRRRAYAIEGVDRVFGNRDKPRLASILDELGLVREPAEDRPGPGGDLRNGVATVLPAGAALRRPLPGLPEGPGGLPAGLLLLHHPAGRGREPLGAAGRG